MPKFTITTEENWLMRVSYEVEAATAEEAEEKIRNGNVPISYSENLENDIILNILSVEPG